MISTISLAILLSRLSITSPLPGASLLCFLGFDDNHDGLTHFRGHRAPFGGYSCILGVVIASLSSLVCTVFLALDIFCADGLLRLSSIRSLALYGIVDFTIAFVVCLLWLAQTIYASHDFAVTVHYIAEDIDWRSSSSNSAFFVSAGFFCTFSGLSIIMWVSQHLHTYRRP